MGPRCFESHLYHYDIPSPYDRQCISPTQAGTRCKFRFRVSELEEIHDLVSEAEDLADGEARDEVLQRLVLLRICGNVHRAKLAANPDCVGRVAREYGRLISVASPGSRRTPRSPRTVQRGHSPEEPDHWSDKGKLHPYYQLRPRDRRCKAVTNLSQSGPVFVPYNLGNTVKEIMMNAVPFDHAGYGHVYAYTWPQHPGYVKIGYTTNLESRMSAWNACMPGLKLLTYVTVPFPGRVEELVHLQLNDVRYMIQRCRSCDGLHLEWFKATTQETTEILNGWRALIERRPLYNSSRRLTESWKARLTTILTTVTAQTLLDELDKEEEELARIKAEELAKAKEEQLARARAEQFARAKAELLAQAAKEESAKAQEATARINEKKLARAKKSELTLFDWDQVLDIFEDFIMSLTPQETKILPAIQKLTSSASGILHSTAQIAVP